MQHHVAGVSTDGRFVDCSEGLVIECVDTEARIDAILPELDLMMGGGLITLEKVRVIVYRPETP